jgi:hypothetical protein
VPTYVGISQDKPKYAEKPDESENAQKSRRSTIIQLMQGV